MKTNPYRTMFYALQINYPSIPEGIRQRYAELLVNRAVRFYIDRELDKLVVDEDLADGKKDCGFYALEDAKETDLCNVIYSEKVEQEYHQEIKRMLKG